MRAKAPGKLILSGEHSVVYGAPALAMAVNRYVEAIAIPQNLPLISFDLSSLSYKGGLSVTALRHFGSRIRAQYQRFQRGECKIYEVLKKSHELSQCVAAFFLESVKRNFSGVRIHLKSDIPIGCGMGSSAATILGVSYALADFFQMDIPVQTFMKLGVEAENMQHGRSSGLDLQVCLKGGCVFLNDEKLYQRRIPQGKIFLVNTGMPMSTTGECVTHASSDFTDQHLLQAFTDVTNALDCALTENNFLSIRDAIIENNNLLTRIGVVPKKISNFIKEIESLVGAAKICGAGSVAGDAAGMVLVAIDHADKLSFLLKKYGYSMTLLKGEVNGVHLV